MEATIATTDKKSGWYVELNNQPRKRIEILMPELDAIVFERENSLTDKWLTVIFGTVAEKDSYLKQHWLKIGVTLDPQTNSIQINLVDDLNKIVASQTVFRVTTMLVVN